MKFGFCLIALAALLHNASAAEEPKLLTRVTALPVVLDPAFQFRKTKIFALTVKAPTVKGRITNAAVSSKSSSVVQEASIIFERQYRLFGAVTGLDQRQRFAYRTKQQIAFNRSLRKFAWHDAARKQRPHLGSEKESFEFRVSSF